MYTCTVDTSSTPFAFLLLVQFKNPPVQGDASLAIFFFPLPILKFIFLERSSDPTDTAGKL